MAAAILLMVVLAATSAASDMICPSYCECYSSRTQVVADCNSKMLASIPNLLPADITTLRLGYNNLTELHNITLEGRGLFDLERLELNDNLFTAIDSGAFHAVPQLTRLDLENNQLRVLHPDTFSILSRLWKLVLNGNPLELPEDGPFLVAPDLQVLELERCGLHRIPPLAFQNLSGLHTIRLTNNLLTTVDLQGPYLMHVAVGSNPLNERGLILNTPSLLVLDLSQSSLRQLPAEVLRTTPHLERLKLERNLLTTIEVEIITLIPQLKTVNLTGNLLTTLHTDTFLSNSVLTNLDLSSNPLQLAIDGGFIYSNSLQFLSLASCNLSRVSAETFRGMPNITHLKLSNNYLRSLSKVTFSVLPNLQSLSVDGNRIYTILGDFASGLTRLVSLNLSRNPVRLSKDAPFLESNSLKELILNECFLEEVPTEMLRLLPNLTTLGLSNNLLATLDVQTVEAAAELNNLYVNGNPLICDCSLLPVWRWCSYRQCEESIVRCRRPRGRTWDVLGNLVCEEGNESPLEDFDVNLEVELVDIPAPSRPPPDRLMSV